MKNESNIAQRLDQPSKETLPIRITVDFKTLKQVKLFDRLIQRLTRSDLESLIFEHAEIDALLSTIGNIRAPIKLFLMSQPKQGTERALNIYQEQVPSPDESAGMHWWNNLSESKRHHWMQQAGNTGSVADAWTTYKRRHEP